MSNMVVQTNVLALNSHRYMKQVGNAQSKSSARLSSGYKINSAADDAAGLAISEKMRAQIRGLDQASKNAQDGISLIQTAEGGMQEIDNMLQRIRELVVSVSNDTNENNAEGTGDRQKMQDEIDQLVAEIDSMSERVEFNKKKVINGSYADTALQLKNAKAEYDRSSLAKVETNAKLSAYKDALGVTGDTASATGTTAYSRLNAAQDAVDAGVQPYKDALKTSTAAEVLFEEARNTYQTTFGNMETALNKVNKEAGEITNAMLDKNNAAYLGDDFARAFTAYQEASNAYGIEGLKFDTTNITAANVLTKTAFTGVSSADDIDTVAYATALAAAEADIPTKAFLDANGAALKMNYDSATTALNDAIVAALGTGKGVADLTVADVKDDVAVALEAYVNAANAYGVDTLNLASQPVASEVGLPAGLKPTVTNVAGTGSLADIYSKIIDGTTASGTAVDKDAVIAALETYINEVPTVPATNALSAMDIKAAYDTAKQELETALGGRTLSDLTVASIYDGTTNTTLGDKLSAYITAAEKYGLDGLNYQNSFNYTALAAAAGGGFAIIAASAPDTTTGPLANTAAAAWETLQTAMGAEFTDAEINAQVDLVKKATGIAIQSGYVDFTDARTAYTDAKTDATTHTSKTNADIIANANDEIDDLSAYATAADKWGVDELDLAHTLPGWNDAELADKYLPTAGIAITTATAATGSAAKLYDSANATLVGNLITERKALGEYGVHLVAKETFTTAEAVYNDLVAKRDTAQKTVNDLTTNVSNTEKEKLRSDMLYSVANQKLDTAKNAVEDDDSQALYFQVGANATQGLEMSIGSVKSDVLGIGDGKGVTNIDVVKDTGLDTTALLDVLDTALSYVTTERSRLGAAQNRLEYTIKSLDISSENLSAAESRIRDTDMAKEMMELTKANTLQQASISMLAQANQAPQSVLQLLG